MARKKIKTLFRVESVLWTGGRCPVRKTFTFQYGYFTSLEEAEKNIPYTGYTDEVLFYIITEIILDRGDLDWSDALMIRTYNAEGAFVDESKVDIEDCIWHGRSTDKISHKVGDIVEVFNYYEQKTKLGIVAKLPYTEDEMALFYKRHEGFWLTIDEDRYGIVYTDGKYRL